MNNCVDPPLKKPRTSPSSPWERTKQYIESQGGFIHDGITFISSEEGKDGDTEVRCVKVTSTSTISAGSELMRIPSAALVTLSTVEQSSIGRFIFELVDGAERKKKKNAPIDSIKLYNAKNDIVLALFLSFLSANENEELKTKDTNQTENLRLYLSTLPENESYNNLPRRWSDENLAKYLTGTSLFNRVNEEKKGLRQDYEMLFDFLQSNEDIKQALAPFPNVQIFDQMLAAVGSRAFDGLGDDELEAMVPLLDLCNHKRGVAESSDISYSRVVCKSDDSAAIVVTAKCDLKHGAVPGITYGAKGNAQLLARYGFTLLDNTEPDGSSNDILEFQLKSNGTYLDLKRGPKAYTYGCFVKAVESFLSEHETRGKDEMDESIDDMEDFLNSCENQEAGGGEEKGEDAGFDLYTEHKFESLVDKEGTSGKELEIQAIKAFINSIKDARDRYAFRGNDLHQALQEEEGSSIMKFSAILVQSEFQTLALYELAAKCTALKLQNEKCDIDELVQTNGKSLQLIDNFGKEDGEMIKKHAKELAETYYRIRHSEMFL